MVPPSTLSRKSPPASQSPSGSKDAPKLRLSCDACSTAKVKCTKERPRCKKCDGNGTTCVYSTSQKFGKVPYKKRHSNHNTQSATRDIMPDTSLSQRRRDPSIPRQDFQTERQLPFEDLMQDVVDSGNLNGSWLPGAKTSTGWKPNSSITMHNDLHTGYESSLVDESMGLSSQLDPVRREFEGAYTGLDFSIGRCSQDLYDNNYPTFLNSSNSHEFAGAIREGGSDSPSELTAPTSPIHQPQLATNDPLYPPSGRHCRPSTHNCQALAYSTLASLHSIKSQSRRGQDIGPSSSSSSSSPPYCLGSHDMVVPTVDNVLRTNRIAVGNLSQLLTCPCALDPHLAILYASITSKILSGYQATAGNKTLSSSPTISTVGAPTAVPLLPALSHTSSRSSLRVETRSGGSKLSVVHMPLTYGAFSLDEEDQESLRQTLLLSELRKTGKIIDRMVSMNFEVTEADVQARGDVSDLYATMSVWLKSELWRTMRKVEEGGGGQMM
jgi:Aflatoxin regulatory protein/Fungal Zn(2)-Cys(6) binuclear cluster domain